MADADYQVVTRITETSREHAFVRNKEQLKNKFERLSGKRLKERTSLGLVKSAVLNLTKKEMSDGQLSLLNLGPKFVQLWKEYQ